MKLLKQGGGFSLTEGGVWFDFPSEHIPAEREGLYTLHGVGNVPVPTIKKGDRLLLPIDEGLAIDADGEYTSGDMDCSRIRARLCGREGTMSMIIVERSGKYLLIALDHGENAVYSAVKEDGLYRLGLETSKPCTVSYAIFDRLADACRRYREIRGLHPIPLTEKLKHNPEIQKLIGGGIFWVWGDRYSEVMYADYNTDASPATGEVLLTVAKRLYNRGIDRALFGIFFDEDAVYVPELYNRYGYIATQYDNYDDMLDPSVQEKVPSNRIRHCDYTRRRMADFPDGSQLQKDGSPTPAWALRGFDGQMYPMRKVCPRVAAERIKAEIPETLHKYPAYRGRFLDVFGGAVGECHHAEHPLTRTECIEIKRDAFEFLRRGLSLITGTEDGFDGILDGLVYSEGMHSPAHFRAKDSGRNYVNLHSEERTEHTKKHMLSSACRVPLWHLTYHDCLLSFPYWGDSTACSHELLKAKTLFACLYGCPPLYSFSARDLDAVEQDIVESYQRIQAVTEKVALLPMTDFSVLSDDMMLQRTVFGDKYEVIANFSTELRMYGDQRIEALDFALNKMR